MLGWLAGYALVAVVTPVLVRWQGRRALYLVALLPAATFGWAVWHTGYMSNGGAIVERYPWVPQLSQELAFRMTTLPWLMVLLVSGIGALVLAYSARYFADDDPGLARFGAVFVGFTGAMYGLVVSDDLLLLYVCWELTTIFSYLLIGHDPAKRASRRAAAQALVVTTLGGLAMLVGFIMLGQYAGTYRWSVIMGQLPSGAYLSVAVALILLGALSKSAIFPFSFWLPAAMAAPTPVSAYLHAAAMVKAGVFLLGLMAPVLAMDLLWRPVVLLGGAVTMMLGGWTALRQKDLKLMLAYGTVSQLGLIAVALGAGFADAALAGAVLLLAHALFKAALFLVVGIIDRATGTRELSSLSGLGAQRPLLAAVAVLAVASMVGLPPTVGFVGKEAVLTAFWSAGAVERLVLVALVAGSVLTVGYGLRFLWGAFGRKPGVPATEAGQVGAGFVAPAAVLAVAGLAAGGFAPALDRLLAPYVAEYPVAQSTYHLALWHGLSPALGLSVLVLAAGLLLYLVSRRGARWRRLRLPATGGEAYEALMGWLDRLAVALTAATQRGSLPFYLGVILVVMIGLLGGALIQGPWPYQVRLADTPLQVVAGVAVVTAAIFAARAPRRLTAMILVGVSGYGVAALFVLHGAPDLALTQFLVETVTIVMFVLVLRRMPARFSERPLRAVRRARVAIGVAAGFVAAAAAFVAVGGRQAIPISTQFPELAFTQGGGRNVVNVTLVDIRAWDTMGEISVLVVAATGVASLIFGRTQALRRRAGTRPEPLPGNGAQWLAGTSPEGSRQSIILQVVTRLLFHAIVLFSIYLLFSGHNAPGGGFAGGLVAGLALVVRYLAGGRRELSAAAPVDAGKVLGTGLFIAVGTGVAALLLGGEVLQSALLDVELPVLGDVHFVTSVLFDIGVYLIVVGLVLDILRSLGAEVDRHYEADRESRQQPEPVKESR